MTPSDPSVQLYTVRTALRADVAATLARVADLGYTRVELFDMVGLADDYRAALPVNGLTAPTAHARLLDGDPRPIFELARDLGVATVIDPRVDPARWTTADDVAGIAAQFTALVPVAAEYGLAIGYHNHAEEFAHVVDGVPALEHFARLVDPAVHLELDTYWTAVAGYDPIAVLGRLGDRVRALHVKDGPISPVKEDQLPVGRGRMDVPGILAAAPRALRVVELDDYAGDVFDAIGESRRYLAGLVAA